MRTFCAFLTLILLCYPQIAHDQTLMDYFPEGQYEFCTAEQPPEGTDYTGNGIWWEVTANQENRWEVIRQLSDIRAIAVTVEDWDREQFFRDFRVNVHRVQHLEDLVLYEGTAAGEGIQIAVSEDSVKIGIPALLGSV